MHLRAGYLPAMSDLVVYREGIFRDFEILSVYDNGVGKAIEVRGSAHDCDLFWPEHESAASDGWLRNVETMQMTFYFDFDSSSAHERAVRLLSAWRDSKEPCIAGVDFDLQGGAIVSKRSREAVAVKLDPAKLDRVSQ